MINLNIEDRIIVLRRVSGILQTKINNQSDAWNMMTNIGNVLGYQVSVRFCRNNIYSLNIFSKLGVADFSSIS